MKVSSLALMACMAARPLLAQETRQLDAHVHGVSTMQLAIEGGVLEITLNAPGMDIVGFEYAASNEADKDAVDAAVRAMLTPETILTLPEAAECRLTEVTAGLEEDEAYDHEGHDHDAQEGHDHGEKKDEVKHDDHDHDHDHGHDHAEHADHGAEQSGEHTEFQARYVFDCAHPEDLTTIGFPFFERFPNAQEIEAQFVTETGAGAADIGRDTAELTLN